ncbi:MAG: xanthine dehydrogenase family protein molybdopterin-binding subunit [Betaproteobacteria bacterium]|nr:xanthine dehydrogenase family protein molybdopterin-binding subunit [Betaproteobacteria bacterium]
MIKSRTRRRLLIAAGLVGGAFVVGGYLFYRPRDRLRLPAGMAAPKGEAWLTAWLRIGADGSVTVAVPRQEMGQGITTALPMLVAEELDCDPASLAFEQAPVDSVYANATMIADGVPFRPDDHGWLARLARHSQYKVGELLGVQATGGSTSVRDGWEVMRRAGAAAREMLIGAGAARWGVAPGECSTELGTVRYGNRSLRYAELIAEAARQPIPGQPALKNPAQFRLIGTALPRLDVAAKTNGRAQFGIDVRVPGLRYAALAQCPVFGGTLKRVDAAKAKAMPGVLEVIELEATSTSAAAVAVVADSWWRAKSALDALEIAWNEGAHARLDSAAQRALYANLLADGEARVYESVGNPLVELVAEKQVVQARYEVPYLAHATMEPINCTALVKDGRCEIWVGTQAPTFVRWLAAGAAGVDRDKVTVHIPFLGGGFGRRTEMGVVVQAAAIARRLPGTPVQLLWSREEDIQHDVYRPMAMAQLRCALDAQGGIRAWHNRIVSQSCTGGLTARLWPAAASDLMKDKTTAEGAFDLSYAMPHRLVEHVPVHQPVPVGFWRSVGHSYNAFFVEGFLDELAHSAKRDPYEFRRALLAAAPRHRRVLETAAQKAGWGSPLPPRTGRGIALAESFHSIVAQVAEVEVGADKALRVKRVVCAIDCGKAVNPGIVAAQMESGIVFGLSAALYGEITLKNGRVEQSNFPDYDVVHMADCPAIETHIVDSGWEHLGGVGEPGTPPIAPAVANAVFAATGQRLRKLPLRLA